jgi:hypothetical protein
MLEQEMQQLLIMSRARLQAEIIVSNADNCQAFESQLVCSPFAERTTHYDNSSQCPLNNGRKP